MDGTPRRGVCHGTVSGLTHNDRWKRLITITYTNWLLLWRVSRLWHSGALCCTVSALGTVTEVGLRTINTYTTEK